MSQAHHVVDDPVPTQNVCLALDVSGSERSAVEHSFDGLAPLFAGVGGPRSALWVVSPDIGGQTAVRFWADVCRTGLGLANPEPFPWCLANAACGAVARRFGITGPNTTLLGMDDALAAAWKAANRGLAQGRFDTAVLIELVLAADGAGAARLRAWRLG